MATNNDIIQIFAAATKLSEISTSPKDSNANDRIYNSAICPIVSINGINIDVPELLYVELSMQSFVPSIKVTFRDISGIFESDCLITNDTVISIYIAPFILSNLLPIRCDFTVTSSSIVNSVRTGKLEMKTRALSGTLRVAAFMKRKSLAISGTSFDSLASISSSYKLGFSSNIENTNDSQTWINSYGKCSDFMESIVNHSYIDDNSFLTGFVDWFYDFNFIELNRIFTGNPAGKKMTVCSVQVPDGKVTEEGNQSTKETDYMITNQISENSWNNYIESYSVIMYNQNTEGYRKYVQYYGYDENEFISEYVDPITAAKEGEIPISKSRIDSDTGEDNLREENISFTDYYVSSLNTHKNYYYADIQNSFNMTMCKGFGLKVVLPAYNPHILMYSCIDVKIYDYNTGVANAKKDGTDSSLSPSLTEDTRPDSLDADISAPNESLSGTYVITGIKLRYDQSLGIIKEELTLNRREIKPSLTAMVDVNK